MSGSPASGENSSVFSDAQGSLSFSLNPAFDFGTGSPDDQLGDGAQLHDSSPIDMLDLNCDSLADESSPVHTSVSDSLPLVPEDRYEDPGEAAPPWSDSFVLPCETREGVSSDDVCVFEVDGIFPGR